ncbi:hypothetical protein KZ810_01215 [Sphingomonas sp. RHCKR47]|uniref:hypothetical protein n=1 Tax=Sphingomonas citricola TaxID=2862498 RepID=UPI001CA550AC|nr:hypothetical protein [Sphingomonas citricola]MBW6522107.1 hypothetical protein [Sphingomonas citricola]
MAQNNPATRRSANRKPADKPVKRKSGVAVAAGIGVVAAGLFGALRFGLFDKLLASRPSGGEHPAPDLRPSAPTPGIDRAPVDFRPDPTAAVPASEREALRPATGPAPTLAATRGELANQTGAAN